MRMLSRVLLRVVPFAAMASIVIAGQATPPTGAGGAAPPAQTPPPPGRAGAPPGLRRPPRVAAEDCSPERVRPTSRRSMRPRPTAGGRSTAPSASTATARRRAGRENGSEPGPSLVVLRDRYGSELGPFLKKGHPMQSGTASRR